VDLDQSEKDPLSPTNQSDVDLDDVVAPDAGPSSLYLISPVNQPRTVASNGEELTSPEPHLEVCCIRKILSGKFAHGIVVDARCACSG